MQLEQLDPLSDSSKSVLAQVTRQRSRHYKPQHDLSREGEFPHTMYVILSGWACRYKQLEDGRRQIIGFCLPGDICNLDNLILQQAMDHSVCTLTPVTVAEITREVIEAITTGHPSLARALSWRLLVATAIQREWAVNLGQRDAFERVGHLLCELFLRLRSVGLTDGNQCRLPLLQMDLAYATGLSVVHVNRTLQDLRAAGLIVLKGKILAIPNLTALQTATLFNSNYLYLNLNEPVLDFDIKEGVKPAWIGAQPAREHPRV